MRINVAVEGKEAGDHKQYSKANKKQNIFHKPSIAITIENTGMSAGDFELGVFEVSVQLTRKESYSAIDRVGCWYILVGQVN